MKVSEAIGTVARWLIRNGGGGDCILFSLPLVGNPGGGGGTDLQIVQRQEVE